MSEKASAKLWVHPTFNTVGSALRRIGERLMAADGERAEGVVVVPDDPSAQWSKLLRHFNVVGRRPAGDQHLEMSRQGGWHEVVSLRPTLLLSFPRVAGAGVKPVRWEGDNSTGQEGYVRTCTGGWHRALSMGSMVYAPARTAGTLGCLYVVWQDYDPCDEQGLEDGEPDVMVAELMRVQSKTCKQNEYGLVTTLVKDEYGSHPASFGKTGCRPWAAESKNLWIVDHLVKEVEPSWKLKALSSKAGKAAQWVRKAFVFDAKEANKLVAAAEASRSKASEGAHAEPNQALVMGAVAAWERRSAAQVSTALALTQSEGEGSERPAELLARARQDADEAAAARVRRDAAEAANKNRVVDQKQGRKIHVCRYPGMECWGCGSPFSLGEPMTPGGEGMVHANQKCTELARVKLLESAAEAKAAKTRRGDVTLQSDKKAAQLAHRFSDQRMEMAQKCLDGRCHEAIEIRKFCEGTRGEDGNRVPCGRGVHAMKCAHVSSYQTRSGHMVCMYCRAKEMNPFSLGTEATLLKEGCRNMLTELEAGANRTAKNIADFEKLERQWMLFMNGDGADGAAVGLREPRHCEDALDCDRCRKSKVFRNDRENSRDRNGNNGVASDHRTPAREEDYQGPGSPDRDGSGAVHDTIVLSD